MEENSLTRSPPLSTSTTPNPNSPKSQPTSEEMPTPSSSHAEKEEEKEDKDSSMVISVHATGHEPDEGPKEEPVPLTILINPNVDPKASAEKCLRRSPRFTTNKFRSSEVSSEGNYQIALPAFCPSPQTTSLRRSPRLLSESDGKTLNSVEVSRKRRRFVAEEEEEGAKGSSRKVKVEGKVGNSPSGMLALPEPETPSSVKSALGESCLSEKCLRSRKIEMHVRNQKQKVEKSAYEEEKTAYEEGKSPFLSEKRLRNWVVTVEKAKVEKSASEEKKGASEKRGVLSEKCLRSRKIEYRVVDGVENGNNKVLSIKGNVLKSEGSAKKSENSDSKQKSPLCFVGEPIPEEEAMERWRWRYELKSKRTKRQSWILNAGEEDEIVLNVKCHYAQAKLGNCIFNIGDCAYVKGEGRKKHVGKILEFFKTMEGEDYFRVQWFFRAEDTVLKDAAAFHDKKRLFYSTLMNDNLLDCIVSKVNVVETTPMLGLKSNTNPPADFYYDMEYCVEYSTFHNLPNEHSVKSCDSPSAKYVDALRMPNTASPLEVLPVCESFKTELALLDLYSGCGGMSTGLSLGAKLSGLNLVTRWAVDADKSACDSLKLNHPETQVRNESAEDFLELLKRWKKLCKSYAFNNLERTTTGGPEKLVVEENSRKTRADAKVTAGEYEVLHLLDICFGDPSDTGKRDLYFKVRWKGYGPEDDTWEPIGGLSNCKERLQDFVRDGLKSKILPLPGDVDVICGGPPCQGISGYNRFRNVDAPLDDERNHQIVVFMDIVKFLKPKYILMENVTDILRFDKGSLGRYALGCLVHLKYQARLGMMAAGCYGLPQFRLRVFIWGAHPSERLPQFPLPTHDVIVRYWPPSEFERCTVAYDEGQPRQLEEAVLLRDAISDLPAVTNNETSEEMAYEKAPETEFQKYIRTTKWEMVGLTQTEVTDTRSAVLYDHRPRHLSEDNYLRVCQIPHRKGANFRDFPGVVVGEDNVVRRDPTQEPVKLPSGELLIPGCCFTYEQGKSKRPFARLWWDENVATIVTVPNIRSHAVLHPEQDRILTIREYARLQGFPDFYRFCGTIKERYCQVGNAVAVPVTRALGYALGMAFQKLTADEPLMTLPPKFSSQLPLIDEIVVLGSGK